MRDVGLHIKRCNIKGAPVPRPGHANTPTHAYQNSHTSTSYGNIDITVRELRVSSLTCRHICSIRRQRLGTIGLSISCLFFGRLLSVPELQYPPSTAASSIYPCGLLCTASRASDLRPPLDEESVSICQSTPPPIFHGSSQTVDMLNPAHICGTASQQPRYQQVAQMVLCYVKSSCIPPFPAARAGR